MNTTRLAILLVALIAGIASVGLVLRGMASARRAPPVIMAAPPQHPTVQVLVAKRDLNVGEKIGAEDMAWQTWPAEALNPAFITDGPPRTAPTGQIAGKLDIAANAVKAAVSSPSEGPGAALVASVVREKILANEPIVRTKLVHPGAGGVMAVTLDSGMRAVALPLSAESAAGGFILPGDHVDVLLTRTLDANTSAAGSNGGQAHATNIVMRNVRVLAIDQNIGAPKSTAEVGATATVECSPEQAEYLVQAKASGTLTLMLRSYADAAGPAEVGHVTHQAMVDNTVRVFRAGGAASTTASTPTVPQ
jgi:pilus assembly protein CpaB